MKKYFMIILFISIISISLQAHDPSHHKHNLNEEKKEICIDKKDLHFHSSISELPRVGKLSNIFGILKSKENILPVIYKIEILNIEHEEIVFNGQTLSNDGNINWKYQFFDGAPHKIKVSVYDNKNNLILSDDFITEVEAVEPPLFSIVRSMIILLSITALGIVIGYGVAFLIWKNIITNENLNN